MFDPRDVNTVVRILRSAGEEPREVSDEKAEDNTDGSVEEMEREEIEE